MSWSLSVLVGVLVVSVFAFAFAFVFVFMFAFVSWSQVNQNTRNNFSFVAGASVASGDVYVVCNTQVAEDFVQHCDELDNFPTSFNGDDVIYLMQGTPTTTFVVLDQFGVEG